MSAEATGWVYRFSPYRGVAFAVHLAIADSVNDQNGDQFWMRQAKLARKARTTRGSVNASIATMLADGTIELIEEGKGGANCYRLVMATDLAEVYNPRQGVSAPKTPGARSADRGVSGEPTGGARSADTEPKGNPSGEPKEEHSGADAPASLLDLAFEEPPELTLAERAKAITDAAWEARTPRPSTRWIAARKMVEGFLSAGWTGPQIEAAMAAAPTWTTGAIEFALRQATKNRGPGPRAQVQERRDDPEGRVVV